jgi:ferrous iron transport protein A
MTEKPRTEGERLTAAEMATGESATVVEIAGGHGLVNRLDALGIRPGKRITKISAAFMHGPVVIRVDRAEVAIGFGMARKIVVQPD